MKFYWWIPLLLTACSSSGLNKVFPDKQIEYKKEKVLNQSLEIPPDLTSSRIQTQMPDEIAYSHYQKKPAMTSANHDRVLPEIDRIKMFRQGDKRWLLVQASPTEVWDRLIQFWQENGILLIKQDPELGLMETDWLENRATIKNDLITDTLRKVFDGLYGSATRDKYRLRLERTEQGTEIYLTHFGMEQDFIQNNSHESDQIYWKIRPRDPELEALMLRQITLYLGQEEDKIELAQQNTPSSKVHTQWIKDQNRIALSMDEPFAQAWRLVGLALDQAGFVVEDRDRSAGVYYIHYEDPTQGHTKKSWWAFWQNDQPPPPSSYKVIIQAQGASSLIQIGDDAGLSNTQTAQRILTLIEEHLSDTKQ